VSAEAKVLAVQEGSVLVIQGVALSGLEAAARLRTVVADAVGHDRFAVLWLPPDGEAEVWGPDDDLAAKVSALLEATK
jgi:hypothetical protein